MTTRRTILLALSLAVSLAATGAGAQAPNPRFDPSHVEAAALRFGLPPDLIAEVIRVESDGQARAVSRAGAMGLMQLMPGTWNALRGRLGLGADPFDPGDNVLAGAAYLRELLDRYGAPGFLAAYNAGPGRYEQSLAGRPLPDETRRYVDRLSGLALGAGPRLPGWREAGLFVEPRSAAFDGDPPAPVLAPAPATSLFVPRRSADPRP